MNRRIFIVAVVLTIVAGVWGLRRQRDALAEARVALSARTTAAEKSRDSNRPHVSAAPSPVERPSSELLRLRNEVSLLRQELEASAVPVETEKESNEDWAVAHSGPKPSEQPGFWWFADIANVGFATPAAAFQSFNGAMRNQVKEPLDNTRMKELWDVPEDFDDPNARYSVDLGEGIGGEVGCRIISQERIASNQVRLTIDYERSDGSSFRREKVLVENNGRWRMQPAKVKREPAKEEK